MSEGYPAPRPVVLTMDDLRGLTVLEQARACVLAGIRPADAQALMTAYTGGTGTPEELLTGATLFYAVAYELELRRDPGLTWTDAQTWAVKLDSAPTNGTREAEAEAAVRAAIATGLPPKVAGELTMAEVTAYNRVRAEEEREARAPRRKGRVR